MRDTARGLRCIAILIALALCLPAGCAGLPGSPHGAASDSLPDSDGMSVEGVTGKPNTPGSQSPAEGSWGPGNPGGSGNPGNSGNSGSSAFPGGAGKEAPFTAKPVVIVAVPEEPSVLDPHFAADDSCRLITNNIYEPLFLFEGAVPEPVPCLAAGYRLLDDLRWEITIREGVYFHDGSVFTADDAVYSVNRAVDPAFNVEPFYDLSTIVGAERTGEQTLVITTRYPDPALPRRLTRLDMVSKAYTQSKASGPLTKTANGTGPYMLDHWTAGDEIVLVRFRGYWGGQPAQDVAVFRFIREPAARGEAVLSGEADIAAALSPEDAVGMPQALSAPGTGILWIRFDQRSGAMVSQAMRQAANYAVGSDELARELFLDYAAPCEGQIGRPGFFGYSGLVSGAPRDIRKAGELLEEAGYAGEPLRLLAESGSLQCKESLAAAVAGQLREAGFNVELDFAERKVYLDALFDPRKAPDMLLSYTANDLYDMGGVYSMLVHKDGFQSTVDNAGLNVLIEAARTEMDAAKRTGLYDELARKLYEDPFAIYLLSLEDIYGAAADLDWAPRQDGRILIAEMRFL